MVLDVNIDYIKIQGGKAIIKLFLYSKKFKEFLRRGAFLSVSSWEITIMCLIIH